MSKAGVNWADMGVLSKAGTRLCCRYASGNSGCANYDCFELGYHHAVVELAALKHWLVDGELGHVSTEGERALLSPCSGTRNLQATGNTCVPENRELEVDLCSR